MKYYSLNKKAANVSFKDAVIKGLAPDKGLYFPEQITPLSKAFFENIDRLSHSEIAFEAIKQFVSPEIPTDVLKTIESCQSLFFAEIGILPKCALFKNLCFAKMCVLPKLAFCKYCV